MASADIFEDFNARRDFFFRVIEEESLNATLLKLHLESPLGYRANMRDQSGRTGIFIESIKAKPQRRVFEILLQHGADVNITDYTGKSFLHYLMISKATDNSVLQILEMMNECRIDIPLQIKDNGGQTAISLAILKDACIREEIISDEDGESTGRRRSLAYLLNSRWLSCDLTDPMFLPFHICVESKALTDEQKISELRNLSDIGYLEDNSHFLDIDSCDDQGYTPVLKVLLCTPFSAKVFKQLINLGADFTVRDLHGNSMLHHLAESNLQEVPHLVRRLVELFTQSCLNVNQRNNDGMTPLSLAVNKEIPNLVIVNLLLENGANVQKDYDLANITQDAIHKALKSGFFMMNGKGLYPNSNSRGGGGTKSTFPSKKYEMIKCLLSYTVHYSKVDQEGRTYLHHCVASDLEDEEMASLCEFLLSKEVDVFASYGENHISAFDLLLSKFPKYTLTLSKLVAMIKSNVEMDCVLRSLARHKLLTPELMKTCQEKGRLSTCNAPGSNFFHYLARIGYKSREDEIDEKVFKQISETVDVNQEDEDGFTPLQIACMRKATRRSIQNLIKAGADISTPTHKSKNSMSHLIVSSERSDYEVNFLLRFVISLDKSQLIRRNSARYTPFLCAATHKMSRELVAEYLLEFVDRRNVLTILGESPLLHCVMSDKNDYGSFKFISNLILKQNGKVRKKVISLFDDIECAIHHSAFILTKHSRILTLTALMGVVDKENLLIKLEPPVFDTNILDKCEVHFEYCVRFSIIFLHDLLLRHYYMTVSKGLDDHNPIKQQGINKLHNIVAIHGFQPAFCQTKILSFLYEKLKFIKKEHVPSVTTQVLYSGSKLCPGFIDFISTASSYLCKMNFNDIHKETEGRKENSLHDFLFFL